MLPYVEHHLHQTMVLNGMWRRLLAGLLLQAGSGESFIQEALSCSQSKAQAFSSRGLCGNSTRHSYSHGSHSDMQSMTHMAIG